MRAQLNIALSHHLVKKLMIKDLIYSKEDNLIQNLKIS